MKNYNVNFERNGEIISDFTIHAENYKKAKKVAEFHKRHSGQKCKIKVKYLK